MAEQYPPNSNKYKEEQKIAGEKKVEKVVSGEVKTKKKNSVSKLADVFMPDDVSDVKSYIFTDIIVPGIKKAISAAVNAFLYGRNGAKDDRSSTTNAYRASYRSYYDTPRESKPVQRRSYTPDDIVIPDRGEAEAVLRSMHDLIGRYRIVTVADMCELCGVPSNYTDNNYGWTDLGRAEVVGTRDGYMIRLPRPMPLD